MTLLEQTKERFTAQLISKPEYIEQMFELHARLHEYASFLPRTQIEKIEIIDGQVWAQERSLGLRLLVSPQDLRTAPVEILNFGAYEPTESKYLERFAKNAKTFFDIGANIGWYSLLLSKRYPALRVLAFEPIPATLAQLKAHVKANHMEQQIEILPLGLSEKNAELVFFFYPEGSVNASLANVSGRESAVEIRCPVRRLDDLVAERNLHVDLLKCDVEGAELLVFKGGKEVLRTQRPIVFTEMLRKWSAPFGYHPNEIISFFKELGYRCFAVSGEHLRPFSEMNEATQETNFFFLHEERHRAEIAEL